MSIKSDCSMSRGRGGAPSHCYARRDVERGRAWLALSFMTLGLCPSVTTPSSPEPDDTLYHAEEWKDDPRFMVSITRLTACKITGAPATVLRVPWEIYPQESMRRHEQGRVVMQLIFDPQWCVRKATIVQSSGFYRLDNVSLEFAMHVKYSFNVVKRVDDAPTITIPIVWGGKHQKQLASPPDQLEWTQ